MPHIFPDEGTELENLNNLLNTIEQMNSNPLNS